MMLKGTDVREINNIAVDIKEYSLSDRSKVLVSRLTALWDGSVRTTHHFLTETDILRLRPFVVEALTGVPTLAIGIVKSDADASGDIAGFVGIAEGKIEMLFVDKEYTGKGVGRQLMDWAVKKKHATMIDVNEQNSHAAAVYRHWGFEVYDRTETDDQGNQFPILRMKLAKG